jgi:hypothetical protein
MSVTLPIEMQIGEAAGGIAWWWLRALLEALAIGVLCPADLGVGDSKIRE